VLPGIRSVVERAQRIVLGSQSFDLTEQHVVLSGCRIRMIGCTLKPLERSRERSVFTLHLRAGVVIGGSVLG